MTNISTKKIQSENWCLPRYICYVLWICAIAVCLANLICLQRRLSKTHSTWSSFMNGRYNDPQMESIDSRRVLCRDESTLAELEGIASRLENKLHSFTAQESDVRKEKTSTRTPIIFRNNIVLMAYKRSGSSFVGQLFNHHPDVLYFFEPIFFLKTLARNYDNRYAYRVLTRKLLRTIFTCNFEENPYFVSQLSDSAFRLSTRVLSEPPMCPNNTDGDNVQNQCRRIHTSTLIDICHSHRHVVVKTIRMNKLVELKELSKFDIEAPWNILKIIHLVRDPRAIINSRAHIDSTLHNNRWTKVDFQENSRALCTEILENLKHGGTGKFFRGMYHVIRYEDIATKTEKATRQLYEFANLPWSDRTSRWLREYTKKAHDKQPFSTTKNATISLNQWRTQQDLGTIRIIEQECSIIMSLLDYNKVKNREHLLDISQPLFRDNNSSSIYRTKNIIDIMLEIENLKDHGRL